MKQKKSWELTDEFWEAVQDVLIRKPREAKKVYQRKSGGGTHGFSPSLSRDMLCSADRLPVEGVTQGVWGGKRGTPLFSVVDGKGRISEMWRRRLHKYDELQGIA